MKVISTNTAANNTTKTIKPRSCKASLVASRRSRLHRQSKILREECDYQRHCKKVLDAILDEKTARKKLENRAYTKHET